MGSLSIWHWIIVIAVVLLLFGRGKISELMGDVAQGIKAFKKGMSDDEKPPRPSRDRADPKTIDHQPRPAEPLKRTPRPTQSRPQTRKAPARARGQRAPVECEQSLRGAPARRGAGAPWSLRAMFDIGWSELVVIGVVALIAIGPKELPGVLRTVGQWMGKIRRMASEFQGQFQEAMREAEMADLKKQVDEMTNAAKRLRPTSIRSATVRKEVESCRPPIRSASRRRPSVAGGRRARAAAPAARDVRPSAASAPLPEPTPRRHRARARKPPHAASDRGRQRRRPSAGERRVRTEDDEKDIEATKAPLMDHLIELRSRLIKALIAFSSTFVFCFFFAKQIYNILVWPFVWVAGAGEFEVHLHRAARIFHHPAQAGDVRRGVPRRSRWWRRRSTCSSRPASTATSAAPSCRI